MPRLEDEKAEKVEEGFPWFPPAPPFEGQLHGLFCKHLKARFWVQILAFVLTKIFLSFVAFQLESYLSLTFSPVSGNRSHVFGRG